MILNKAHVNKALKITKNIILYISLYALFTTIMFILFLFYDSRVIMPLSLEEVSDFILLHNISTVQVDV